MPAPDEEVSPKRQRQEMIEKYWLGDRERKVYLLRRQRKTILENCRRIAVLGASSDPESPSFVAVRGTRGGRVGVPAKGVFR